MALASHLKARTILPRVMMALAALFVSANIKPVWAEQHTAPNLLPTACHFITEIEPQFSSMLGYVGRADCETPPKHSPKMVWLSLDTQLAMPVADTDYKLVMLRHWTERAVVQFHYADGTMLDYDIGAFDFDDHWSVGNYISFDAPARASPLSKVLVGLQNPSSVKLFHEMTLVKSDDWQEKETAGWLLTTILTGVLLAMFFYNIALAAVLRFNFHFHYCMVALAALVYNLVAYGYLSYLMPGVISHGTQMNLTIIALGLNGLAGILFLCSFLEDGIITPKWLLAARTVGYSFFGFSIVYANMRGPYTETLELWLHITSFAGVVFVLSALIHAIRNKSKAAIFYAVGWMLPVAGVLTRNLREFNILPHSDYIGYVVSIGISLESIIFAVGIAYRISQIMNERDLAKLETAKAKAASQAKTDFLAHMSHEIRNPMSTIIGLSKLTAETNLNAQQREYIRNIQTSGDALMSLLNDTLDISKIEAGKVTIENVVFEPRQVFERVRAVVGPKAEEKALELIFEGEDSLPRHLKGDPTRMGQILINLANNSVKFTEKGHVRITVSAMEKTDQSIYFCCTVADSGVGMSKDQLARLFKSFSQGDTSINRKYGGTGLGLAICKQLVELMGGKISVESRLRVGSNFYFTLPFDVVNAVDHETKEPAEAASNPVLEDVRILVAEDNHINQLLIRKLLEQTKAELDIVSSGEEAVTAASSKRYDVILMDIHMPGIDGLEATQAIRAQETAGATPIIALTGSENLETKEACIEVGMNDQVIKPFKPATLFSAINLWREKSPRLSE